MPNTFIFFMLKQSRVYLFLDEIFYAFYKGNIYFVSTEDDGIVLSYTNKGEELWKEQIITISDFEDYVVQGVNYIVVVDNSKVLISFEASEVLEDRINKPTTEFAVLKAKFGTRVNDTIED